LSFCQRQIALFYLGYSALRRSGRETARIFRIAAAVASAQPAKNAEQH